MITDNKTNKSKNIVCGARKNLIKKYLKLLNNHKMNGQRISIGSFKADLIKKFPYKTSKGFIDWDDMIDILLYSLIQNNILSKSSDKIISSKDRTIIRALSYVSAACDWMSNEYPVFLVTEDLIDILLGIDTKIDDNYFNSLYSTIDFVFDNMLFIFPENIIKYYLENAPVEIIEKIEKMEGMKINKFNEECGFIDHCFVTRGKTLLNKTSLEKSYDGNIVDSVSITSLASNGQPFSNIIIIPKNNDENIIKNTERVETFGMTKIIVQCLLLITSKPDLIITAEYDKKASDAITLKNKGFDDIKTEKVLYPRVLNLDYVEKVVRSDDKSGKVGRGSQSPKRPHWRLGYTVNKPIGKMKGIPSEQWERKLITVKPYLVRGNTDQDD